MKKIIYFLILTLWIGIATSVFAQNYDCVGEVRATTPTVNIWDWRQPTYPVFIKNDQNTPGLRDTLRSPFETGQFSYNENTAHLALPLIKDYDPTDGWELVYKSFGTGTSSINAVIAPAFALYNKHTGVLRAFSFITSVPLTSNGALMSIEFIYPSNLPSRKESALFTHMESKAHPLINFTKAAKVKATNLFRRSAGGYWLYAEFVTGYDPCACAHQTQLSVVPEIHNVSNVFLSTTGTVTQIIDNGATKDTGFQTVMKVVGQAAEAGSKAHKSTDDFLKNFAKILYNQPTVKRDSIAGNNDKKEEIKEEFDLFPNWVKGIPKLANIIGIADFILNIGDTNKETPPISYEVNLKTTGTISSEAKIENPKITVPGSDNAGVQPSIIPYYNNTMGVFNLLKYPTLKYVEYEPFPTKTVRYVTSNGQQLHTYQVPKVREYQLAAPLEFVLNPAAELEVVDMKTSFVVDLKLPEISAAFPGGMGQALTEDNKFTYGPFEREPSGGRTRVSTKYEERIYDESGLELLLWQDDAYDIVAGGRRSYRISKTLYRTTPVNTGFFNTSKFLIFRNLTNPEPEIFCKITLIVRRKNKPNAPDQIMVFTYN